MLNRYRELRKELDLTQVQLARLTGVAQATISDRETGRARITREALMAMFWLNSLSRWERDALLADPSKLED